MLHSLHLTECHDIYLYLYLLLTFIMFKVKLLK